MASRWGSRQSGSKTSCSNFDPMLVLRLKHFGPSVQLQSILLELRWSRVWFSFRLEVAATIKSST